MGCCHSQPSRKYPQYKTAKYDWDRETGAYVPHRHQRNYRRWQDERRNARFEKRRAEELARAQVDREVRATARNRRYQPVEAKKAEFRRQYDEYMAAKYQ
ncbi:hypothetical protein ACLMJK_000403 [Lecanora helva]